MFVKPAGGRTVLRPDTLAPLPAEGAEVPDSSFWQRRLGSGEVELTDPPAATRESDRREPATAEEGDR